MRWRYNLLDDKDNLDFSHLPPAVDEALLQDKTEDAIRRVASLHRDDAVGGSVVVALLEQTRLAA